jgi:hypothetical protein
MIWGYIRTTGARWCYSEASKVYRSCGLSCDTSGLVLNSAWRGDHIREAYLAIEWLVIWEFRDKIITLSQLRRLLLILLSKYRLEIRIIEIWLLEGKSIFHWVRIHNDFFCSNHIVLINRIILADHTSLLSRQSIDLVKQNISDIRFFPLILATTEIIVWGLIHLFSFS